MTGEDTPILACVDTPASLSATKLTGLGVLEKQTDGGTREAVSCRWTHGRFHSSNHGHRVSRRLVEGKVEYKLDGGNFRNHAISEWRDRYGVIKRTFDDGRFKPRKKKHTRLLQAALKMEVTPTPGRPRRTSCPKARCVTVCPGRSMPCKSRRTQRCAIRHTPPSSPIVERKSVRDANHNERSHA